MSDAKLEPDPRFNEHMTALGHLCAIWSVLEARVDHVIWDLANVERMAGACMTAQMIGPGPRSKALIALVRLRGGSDEFIKRLNKFAEEFGALGARRNRYIHDQYAVNPETLEMLRVEITANKIVSMEQKPVTVDEMQELRRAIKLKIMEFDKIYDQMISDLPSWPRTEYEESPGIHIVRNYSGTEKP